jgi:16S rRNA (guanine1207-N2)-methyltransferase
MARDRIAAALAAGLWTLPESGPIGLFRPRADTDLSALPGDRLRAFVTWAPDAAALAARGIAMAEPDAAGFAAAAVFATRARVETLGLIAAALARCRPGGAVLIDGRRGDGIDGLWRACRAALGGSDSVTLGHGRAFALDRPETLPDLVAQWATEAAPRRVAGGWLTRAGVFSADGPDPGSALLGDRLHAPLGARVADLAAGWGYLAARALAADPGIERLDLIEADANALACARENVTDPRARFHWADATAWQGAGGYDSVLMNPPFHDGRAADPALGRAFIARAAQLLRPGGRLWLVANRQLPYEPALDAGFARHEILTAAHGFKVIRAEGPRAGPPRRGGRSRLDRPAAPARRRP